MFFFLILESTGKLRSVEELEAHYRQEQGVGESAESSNQSGGNKEDEKSGFRKVVSTKNIML